jgi:hypothetical protein
VFLKKRKNFHQIRAFKILEKTNNIKVFGGKKTKISKLDRSNPLTLHMREGGES